MFIICVGRRKAKQIVMASSEAPIEVSSDEEFQTCRMTSESSQDKWIKIDIDLINKYRKVSF